MATKKKMLQAAAGNAGGGGPLNVEDVFGTYLYDGTSSAQTITNGIDLSGEGGLTWIKSRNFSASHALFDTERGGGSYLSSNEALGNETPLSAPLTFNSDGFTINTQADSWNGTYYSNDYASWTFRKAPKFFDVVTYSGNATNRTVSHNLGCDVGMILIKNTSGSTGNWRVYHRGMNGGTNPEQYSMRLNQTNAQASESGAWNNTAPTSSVFSLGTGATNESGKDYVAYLFAHNDGDGEFGPDGDQDIIKCGSFTTNASFDASIDLGFEPQWVMIKKVDAAGGWFILDSMRGFTTGGNEQWLIANATNSEGSTEFGYLTATGFEITDNFGTNSEHIYIAIRRGTKVPESGTEVFDVNFASATATNPAVISTIPTIDMAILSSRTGTDKHYLASRLTQAYLKPNSTDAEAGAGSAAWKFDNQNGFYGTTGTLGTNYLAWMWKRAPGFFDVVAYEWNGTATRNVEHNLGVPPEMYIVKRRNSTTGWYVRHKDFFGTNGSIVLNTTAATAQTGIFTTGGTTDTTFPVANDGTVNASGGTYVAYLFATLDGISKVGSYTGDGTTDGSKVIDCGFTSGARFVLIKSADAIGNWNVFDTARGIIVGNDALLRLNSTTAEVSTDQIDPHPSGFKMSSGSSTIVNISGVSYIFYAIA